MARVFLHSPREALRWWRLHFRHRHAGQYAADDRGIINITNLVANTTGLSFLENERIALVQDINGTAGDEGTQYVTGNAASTGWFFDASANTIYYPEFEEFTGQILYIENRTPITRSTDQKENIAIVIEF